MTAPHRRSRRRLTASVVLTGLGGSLAVALSMGASLSGFAATITNNQNTAASGTLAISETSGSTTCNSYDTTATCSTINKYGGIGTPLAPGQSQTVTVAFANNGGLGVSSSSLTPAACSASSTGATGSTTPSSTNTDPTNLCSQLTLKVYQAATATGTPIYSGTLAAFTSAVSLGALAAGASQSYTFVVTLPSTATTAVQGQKVLQSLTWTFNV